MDSILSSGILDTKPTSRLTYCGCTKRYTSKRWRKIHPNEEKEQMFIVSGEKNPYIGMCQNWKPYHIDFHLAVS